MDKGKRNLTTTKNYIRHVVTEEERIPDNNHIINAGNFTLLSGEKVKKTFNIHKEIDDVLTKTRRHLFYRRTNNLC